MQDCLKLFLVTSTVWTFSVFWAEFIDSTLFWGIYERELSLYHAFLSIFDIIF